MSIQQEIPNSAKTFLLDEIEYNFNDISDKAQYFVEQIEYCKQEDFKLRAELDRLLLAQQGYTNLLKEELNDDLG